jgi:hypothetical protein
VLPHAYNGGRRTGGSPALLDQRRDLIELSKQALIIEEHYGCPMDIEWGKDGETGKIYILQARPETVQSRAGRTVQALLAQGQEVESSGERPLDRPAHRRGSGSHHPRREGDDARAERRRARR